VSPKSRSNRSLSLLLVALTGCTSWFLKGAEQTSGPPSSSRAVFSAPVCTTTEGETLTGADVTYYLADEGGPVLYELDANGEGARITNTWSDELGTHFFVWVGTGPGFRFLFPSDGGAPTRFVYTARSYQGDHSQEGVTKPIGDPAATCELRLRS
jgi:hypothetical protein